MAPPRAVPTKARRRAGSNPLPARNTPAARGDYPSADAQILRSSAQAERSWIAAVSRWSKNFRTHLPSAERTGAVSGKNLGVVRKCQKLLMNALKQDGGELLRRMGWRKIRPSHITHEQRVSCKHRSGPSRLTAIRHQHANAFERVSRSLQKPQAALSELDPVAIRHR